MEEQRHKLLRSEQSLQASQTKEQDLRKKMEVSLTMHVEQAFKKVWIMQLSLHIFLLLLILSVGAAERKEQCVCPVGPEEQAAVPDGRGEKELRPEPQKHPVSTR